ncbi:sugar ABC transporter substrate-binding protein [Kitasatospora sp. NPDC052896]|uniref:sugar ABC transporter substrate-binding protein n=1 Tax=Kitasatospora sp. NPDC052896 TaxID=3364061 RepID=UPI0037C4FFBE
MKLGLARAAVAATVLSLLLVTAACGYARQAGGSARAAGGTVRIGLLLPESKTTRYEQFDRPLIEAAIRALAPGAQLDYYNANQNATQQQTQVDTALTKGDQVLILDAVDARAVESSVRKAHDAGVRVVAYDRLAQGPVDSYVSFDNVRVGRLQGEALVAAVGDRAPGGRIIMINGSPTDPNAAQYKQGAHQAINGRLTVAREYDTPDWDPNNANQEAAAAITALGPATVVGVYAANDGMAAGIATALRAADLSVPLTGQDAQLDAVQRILAGTQTMSIYKPYRPEAEVAAEMAVALARHQPLPAALAPTAQTNGSGQTVPSVLVPPTVLTRDNIRSTVVADGLYPVARICTPDYASACGAAGFR